MVDIHDKMDEKFNDIVHSKEIADIKKELESIIEPDYIDEWMDTANEAFGYKTPSEIIEEGNGDRIREMVYHIQTGSPY